MQKTLEVTRSLDLSDVKHLANVEGPCITMYMPLQPAANTSRMDYTRLKALIRQAEGKLNAQRPDLDSSLSRELIESLHLVEGEAGSWGGEGGSLVILRSPEVFRAYQVKQELDETAVVGDFFHVFPTLRALQFAQEVFYLLALSQNHVRLLRCTPTESEAVPLGDSTPTSLEQWLNTRLPNSAPDHGAAPSEAGSTAGSFTSTQDRDNKEGHISNFFHVINKAVFDILRDRREPLVLCGVEYERVMYKGINTYQHLLEEGVHGSPESLKGGEMHARALEVVQEFFTGPAKKALGLWEKIAGTERASTNFEQIVKAAFEARIAHLFAAGDAQILGTFNRSTMTVGAKPQEDLVNAAALQTMAFGGDVFLLDRGQIPGGQGVAAVLRY